MTCLCGHRGFAGPSACVLEKGHEGDHKYGDYQQALAIAAAKELKTLREQLAAITAERDEYRIKHEVACSTLELVKERRDAVQRALAAQCKHTKDLEAERDELLALVIRYRKETPLGHQPHMIAHLADAAIAKVRKP